MNSVVPQIEAQNRENDKIVRQNLHRGWARTRPRLHAYSIARLDQANSVTAAIFFKHCTIYSGLYAKSTGSKEQFATCLSKLEALRDGTNEEVPQHPGMKFILDDQYRDGTLKRYLDELRAEH